MRRFIPKFRRVVSFFARIDEQHRQTFVNKSVRSMLHLAGRVPFGMYVRDLFQLERAFQGHWKVDAPAQVKKVGGSEKLLRQFFYVVRFVQQMLKLNRKFRQLLSMVASLLHRKRPSQSSQIKS